MDRRTNVTRTEGEERHRQTDRQTHRHIDRLTDRRTDRHTDKQFKFISFFIKKNEFKF